MSVVEFAQPVWTQHVLGHFSLFFADTKNEDKAFTGSKYSQSDSPINSNK